MPLIIIKIAILALLIIAPTLLVFILLKVLKFQSERKLIEIIKDKANKGMKESKIDFFNYDRVRLYLSKNGVDYMFESKINPFTYFSIRFVLMTIGFVSITLKYDMLLGLIAGIIGFNLFDILIHISNQSDNDKMLLDIKSMYDSLKIQTKAGVYLTNALAECYLSVETERLKVALLELNNKIMTRKDIESAVDEFNVLFNNKYIDTFCIVIKQSMENGQSINALADISNQISDIQNSVHVKQQNALDRRTQIIELLVFIGIISITIYYLFSELWMSILFKN